MFSILNKYSQKGYFDFSPQESYREQCNAPDNNAGIYLIYKRENSEEHLLYIGSSGQRTKEGKIKIRKGGIKDRLINGYHPNRFGLDKRIKRYLAFPQQMQSENISLIRIYWYVTYDDIHQDFPTDIERILLNEYHNSYKCLPNWHQ